MKKVGIVYWSGTGNTEAMASILEVGLRQHECDVSVYTADRFSGEKMNEFDVIAFGCPSMGDEVLEESEFEPMFNECEKNLKGTKIALFGSYDWGDGQWMREWNEKCESLGAEIVTNFVICQNEPDSEAEVALKTMATKIANAN